MSRAALKQCAACHMPTVPRALPAIGVTPAVLSSSVSVALVQHLQRHAPAGVNWDEALVRVAGTHDWSECALPML